MTMRIFSLIGMVTLILVGMVRANDPFTPEQASVMYASGNWKVAVKAYQELTDAHPKTPLYWYRLGTCRLHLKEYRAALSALKTAQANGAQEGPVQYQLACVYARLLDTKTALDCLEKSVAAGFAKAKKVATDEDLIALRDEVKFKSLIEKLEHPTRGMKGADALDHWIGEWDVYSNGQRVGHNRIVKTLDGFGVEEFWEDYMGGKGRSLFVFEAAKGRWKQLWTDDKGWVVEKIGTPIENGIYLEGTSTLANGSSQKSREYLTKKFDGTVHQLIENWDESTKSWTVRFDGKYVRKEK